MGRGNAREETADMMENEKSEVTEYERERLERIKRNRNMLANLQVQDIATALESVPKKRRGQSSKGKEKVDIVYPRRTTRLSTRTKTPTKIVDWSSSESDSVIFSEGSAKKKKKKTKKASSPDEELSQDDIPKKQDDDEYEPSGASESDQDEEDADEPEDDEPLQLSRKKQRGKNSRSSGKRAESGKYSVRLKSLSRLVQFPKEGSKNVDTDDGDTDLERAIRLSMKQDESREEQRLKGPGANGAGTSNRPIQFLNEGSKNGDTDGYDTDLEQAILLSMQEDESREEPRLKGTNGAGASKQRRRKGNKEVKFTQSEVEDYFVSIAGSDVGAISLELLENAAMAHDFIWSEEELQDMIDVFDENDDGFLSLSEFRAMAARCKLMEAT